MNKKRLIILISIIIALAVLACVGIFAISGGKASKIADKLDLGEKYLEELEYEKALAVYKEILEIDLKNVEAYLGLADTYIAMGEYEKALEYAEEGYGETESRKLERKIEEVGTLVALAEESNVKEKEEDAHAEGNEEHPTITEVLEPGKIQVTVEINKIAAAYSQYMYSECMESSATFGLFDITGDGIPELFSGRGSDVVTYWQGECWDIVSSVDEREWYYNEETQEAGMYYYFFREWDGTEEEWINFFSIDTSIGEYPREWKCWGERIEENINLSQYTFIDIRAYDKEKNKDVTIMKETLRDWFTCQTEYEYLIDDTPSDLELINNLLDQYACGEVFDYVVINQLPEGIEAIVLTNEVYSVENLEYDDIIQPYEEWGDEISRIAGWYINGTQIKSIFLSGDEGNIPAWINNREIYVSLCPPLKNGIQLIEVAWSISGHNNGAEFFEICDNEIIYAFGGTEMFTVTEEGRIQTFRYFYNSITSMEEFWYTEYEYANQELKLINEWVEYY